MTNKPARTTPPRPGTLYRAHSQCPDNASHTPIPAGYFQFHEWAAQMRKTHVQTQCPTCGFWVVWAPREVK